LWWLSQWLVTHGHHLAVSIYLHVAPSSGRHIATGVWRYKKLFLGVSGAKCYWRTFWVPSNISASLAFSDELVCFGYAKPNDVMDFKCLITCFCWFWRFRFLAPLGSCQIFVLRLKSRAIGYWNESELMFSSNTKKSVSVEDGKL